MTIASEITRINGNIAAAYTAAGNKGATLPATQNSANLATCIGTISTGITPSGTISIATNGTYDVTNYASADVSVSGGGAKFGATIDTFLGDIDGNGVLQAPREQSDLIFSGVVKIGNSALTSAFANRSVKTVKFPNLTEVLFGGCQSMLENCRSVTSLSMPELTTISGLNGCYYMCRGCSALTTVSMPKLVSITDSNGCSHAFNGCSSLTSFSLPELTTVSGVTGMGYMFYNCTSLQTVDFPKIDVLTESNACSNMCYGCTALTDVYFRALTTTSFGSNISQFRNMMQTTGTTTTHTLHFPSNLQSTISGLTGYPLFGGTSGYVVCAFDLDPTE